jgi:hypothetical protein
MVIHDYSNRRFELWEYSVSFSRLLLRSPRSETQPTRVDILFQNVVALGVTVIFDGLVVREATPRERARVVHKTGLRETSARVYLLEGTSANAYVVAGTVAAGEDRGEYFDASPLWVSPR